MSYVSFLSEMTPQEVRQAYAKYSLTAGADWLSWCRTCAEHGVGSLTAVQELGRILRGWSAVRPYPLRRTRAEAQHEAPYLEDLVQQALVHIRTLGDISLREIDTLSAEQEDAMAALWELLLDLPSRGKASCVGITKATMFLSQGRIGPSLDSRVREKLRCLHAQNARDWLAQLRAAREDLITFEARHLVRIEDLVPEQLGPLAVGRAYDVIAWSVG